MGKFIPRWRSSCEGDTLLQPFGPWSGSQKVSPSGGPASIVEFSTEQQHSGAQSIKCFAAGTNGSPTAKADVYLHNVIYMEVGKRYRTSAWYYIPLLPTWIKTSTIMDIEGDDGPGSSEGFRVWFMDRRTPLDPPHLALAAKWSAPASRADGTSIIPRNQWFRVTVEQYLHETNGENLVYLNNRLELEMRGIMNIRPTDAGIFYNNTQQFGLTANSTGALPNGISTDLTYYVDDILIEEWEDNLLGRWVICPVILLDGKRVPKVAMYKDPGRSYVRPVLDANKQVVLDAQGNSVTVNDNRAYRRENVIDDGMGWCLSKLNGLDFSPLDSDPEIINLFEDDVDQDVTLLDMTIQQRNISPLKLSRIETRLQTYGIDTSNLTQSTKLFEIIRRASNRLGRNPPTARHMRIGD